MNRQQRRRADRAAAKFDPESQMMVTPLGHRFRAERVVDLPPKAPGLHRWIVSMAYNVTDDEAAASFDPFRSALAAGIASAPTAPPSPGDHAPPDASAAGP